MLHQLHKLSDAQYRLDHGRYIRLLGLKTHILAPSIVHLFVQDNHSQLRHGHLVRRVR